MNGKRAWKKERNNVVSHNAHIMVAFSSALLSFPSPDVIVFTTAHLDIITTALMVIGLQMKSAAEIFCIAILGKWPMCVYLQTLDFDSFPSSLPWPHFQVPILRSNLSGLPSKKTLGPGELVSGQSGNSGRIFKGLLLSPKENAGRRLCHLKEKGKSQKNFENFCSSSG